MLPPLEMRSNLRVCVRTLGPTFFGSRFEQGALSPAFSFDPSANLPQQLGASHPGTAASLNNLASLYDTQGKDTEAEPLYQRALAIFENILGQNHPNSQTVRRNYASLLQAMEHDGEAKQRKEDF
ncbi:tetratricopeptide repeat protein [Ktedonobacteria bacterium brp13]|nr:tetratricopeptide repeat protein [Ktedonobacteria bacterium brp13]